jgi:predicted ArsR family transcriptional regulator
VNTNPIEALLGTTRGQIVELLRESPLTVNDLADKLHLTPNAVRAHLSALQDDGIVIQTGTQPGTRKPHALFNLSPAARERFSSLYIPVLNNLLQTIADRFPDQFDSIVREIGRRLADSCRLENKNPSLFERADHALKVFADFGAHARIEREEKKLTIRGTACPLAATVSAHPNVCALLETLLSRLLNLPVHERCTKGANPQCCFVVN